METTRGEILKGLIEAVTFYIRASFETLPGVGIPVTDFRAVGGGSKSDAWIQISADILGRPFVRPKINEAGVLGAAILAGVGCGVFYTSPSWRVLVGYSYGVDAIRTDGHGAHSIGILLQLDLAHAKEAFLRTETTGHWPSFQRFLGVFGN